ncbi:MAG: histidine triad nucleotide-binding protein [Acidimicrobiales bacterium]
MRADCLFCRIVDGEIPSDEVASGPATYAFRDVAPQAPTHVLVVPRRHIDSADDVRPSDAETVAELFSTAQRAASAEGLTEQGYRLVFNVGHDAQNTVGHLHMHLLGGRAMGWPPG